jgi:hypothetical protein
VFVNVEFLELGATAEEQHEIGCVGQWRQIYLVLT